MIQYNYEVSLLSFSLDDLSKDVSRVVEVTIIIVSWESKTLTTEVPS